MPASSPPAVSPPSTAAAAWSLLLEQCSRAQARRMLAAHGDVLAALAALRGPLSRGSRLRAALARRVQAYRENDIGLLCQSDAQFPALLAAIPDPPLLLSYRGDLSVLEKTAVAIVGTRRASQYGLAFAHELGSALVAAGLAVVSGLALGIDSAAHRGALQSEGPTVAMLGSGLNRIAPLANVPLARRILSEGGLLFSEYSPETQAAPFRFPERNRLISGLSAGVVVVEASARSGSLITARLAMEQGREVMAAPGLPGLPGSAGVNRLLKSGAALVETAEDVLMALGRDLPDFPLPASRTPAMPPPGLRGELARMLEKLDGHPQSLDSLAVETGADVRTCATLLTELELSGFVRRVAGGYIRRPSGF